MNFVRTFQILRALASKGIHPEAVEGDLVLSGSGNQPEPTVLKAIRDSKPELLNLLLLGLSLEGLEGRFQGFTTLVKGTFPCTSAEERAEKACRCLVRILSDDELSSKVKATAEYCLRCLELPLEEAARLFEDSEEEHSSSFLGKVLEVFPGSRIVGANEAPSEIALSARFEG